GRGSTLIENLVGMALDRMAGKADLAYLAHAKLSAQQVRERLKELQALPPLPEIGEVLNWSERCMYLETVQLVRRGGTGVLGTLDGPKGKVKKATKEELKALAALDWEPALRNGNKFYDRMVAALRFRDRDARDRDFKQIEDDLGVLKGKVAALGTFAKM